MTDRELLELAAKAHGGIDYYKTTPIGLMLKGGGVWSPLMDDGDALRLAVKLGMTVLADPGIDGSVAAQIDPPTSPLTSVWADELAEPDPYAATRRAIVRAAAEIGKGMNNDEILQAVKEAGIEKWWDTPNATNEGYQRALLKIGKIIEKRTIERCAEYVNEVCTYGDTHLLVKAIRKLGEQE